jgi:hypothetical protein
MRYRNVTSIFATALLLASCDSRFKSRIVVSASSSLDASGLVSRASATVARYAKDNGIPCTSKPGSAIDCFKQPIHIFVLPEANGASICYLAMGAQFESGKFASRISQLQQRITEEFGAPFVVSSAPQGAQCMIPQT